jgi:putative spermidine/putrescine transport system substrate-binding protein
MTDTIGRRAALSTGGLAAAAVLSPRTAAASTTVVAAHYPNTWETAYRTIVAPVLQERHQVELVITPLLAFDQVARALAQARGRPPFDCFCLDPGPRRTAVERGLVQQIDRAKLPNLQGVSPSYVDEWGVGVAMQVVGIAYNPSRVEKPTGWRDLFEPKYHRRVAITGFGSTFGTVAMIEIAKAFGGSETNMEPAFEAVRRMLPNVGAVALNSSQLPSLFQQGQIDIFYTNTNNVAALKAQGVNIEFVQPDTGSPAFATTMHIHARSAVVNEAHQYINVSLEPAIQAALQQPPPMFIPTQTRTPLAPEIAALVGSHDALSRFIQHDWGVINPQRPAWIERFNREVRA